MTITREHDRQTRRRLAELLADRILVTDGATGTALEHLKPTAADFGGDNFFGCNEMLNIHAPHIVKMVHRSYLEAGADILETNSFNGSPIVLAEYGIASQARDLARRSAELAREAISEFNPGRDVFVMGSMGPGTRAITVTGGITFDEVTAAYREYTCGLLEGGVDLLVLETVQDTLNLKAALLGVQQAQDALDRDAPVAVSVTIEPNGTMLAGQTVEALYHTISNFNIFSIGLNCATGPAVMTDHLRTLAALSRFPVSVWPNAGLPDHEGRYSDGPDLFREVVGRFAREGFINIVGGCCGTTPDHIRAIRAAVDGIAPRKPNPNGRYPALAGAEALVVEPDNRPVFVGERTNTIGSRKFKRLIGEERWDEAAEIGRAQVRKGAMVLDVCAADPDRDEVSDFANLTRVLLRKVRVPLLVDTTDPAVVATALKMIGGKPAINSVNLEDGGERLRQIAALSRQFGAALICGLIDDDPRQGMAVTVERKLEVADKIHRILRSEFTFHDQDIIFDPLVFPAGTGDENYIGSAAATIEGTRRIKERYPECLTILGISNVSFGLPLAGREVVNSVFLYLCAKAGLDFAIVNTEGLRRYPTIPEEDRALAEQLLMKGDSSTIAAFTARWREAKVQTTADDWANLTPQERVARAVIEARREGLTDNLNRLLQTMSPLEIINGPLMAGMDEVGKLFGDNRLIVAEVLESAEVMKVAVDHLRPHFPPGASGQMKGKMLLATVKGDVHDIGKNLVDMILSNNGFEVINLGIKVPPETLIAAVHEHHPDFIGLSGLLVRSAQQMVHTAADLAAAGIDLPLLVGGAALTKRFTLAKIAPAYNGAVMYAAEAMDGLTLANQLIAPGKREALILNWRKMRDEATTEEGGAPSAPTEPSVRPPRWIETDVPQPPDLTEHILDPIPIELVWRLVNRQMLFGKHLGVKGVKRRLADKSDEKFAKLSAQVEAVVREATELGILRPRAIYRWFAAEPVGEGIRLTSSENKSAYFHYPRQRGRVGISAADWVRPPDKGGDFVGLFVAGSGLDTAPIAAEWRAQGRLLDSLILQSVAIEIAEAAAEFVHARMRTEWGIADPADLTIEDIFRTKYRGIRLSFGYPACPQLEDQAPLFELLKPERIGVSLTDGYMMHPEGAVSAVVFHHPRGMYYAV